MNHKVLRKYCILAITVGLPCIITAAIMYLTTDTNGSLAPRILSIIGVAALFFNWGVSVADNVIPAQGTDAK